MVIKDSLAQTELERTPEVVAVSEGHGGRGLFGGPGPFAVSDAPLKQTSGSGAKPQGSVSSLLVHSVISRRWIQPSYKSNWAKERDDKDGKTSRRIRRLYQRYFAGVACSGGRLRFLTLTTSDQAITDGLDIHRSWACLLKRLRRRVGPFEYIGVREVKGDRQHLHLVFRGSFIDQGLVSALWADIHRSPVVDIRAMQKVKGGARELAKYLGKQAMSRYWQSYGWVFKGWVGWSRAVSRVMGAFPTKAILVGLAHMGMVERKEAMWVLCPQVWMDLYNGI